MANVKTKETNGVSHLDGGDFNRTQAFAKHGAAVHPTPSTQWAVLNSLGEATCSMWRKDMTDRTTGICNFRGGDRDCGDDINVGDLVRIVMQDGYPDKTGVMKTTYSNPLPSYWRVVKKLPPNGDRSGHKFDYLVEFTNQPVKAVV